ncbi:MAG: hypothetical protein JW953_21610 [Anaerolineae bacterium]|nr:hypothetical protein [Anaerolineae bacterium]
MKNSKILLLIIALVIPLFCVVAVVAGALGYSLISTTAANSSAPEISGQELEAQMLAIAAEYASSNNLELAQQQLHTLGLPNAEQYLSFMLDRYIQEGRGADDADAMNLYRLADALGVTTVSVVAALSSPTPLPTPTLPPTATPLPTDTPLPTAAPTEIPTEAPPTDTPVPADTPEPPTPTPGPPTNTPEPTATPEPTQPPVDFIIVEQRMLSRDENGGCMGSHNIFVTILDVNGNPLDGVTVEDTFKAVPPHKSGEKGPGKLEYDLWKNGFSLEVTAKEDGSPATSQVTEKLSSVDHDIPNPWLSQGGYCGDDADCTARKNTNQLCAGHYSYAVTFQKTY